METSELLLSRVRKCVGSTNVSYLEQESKKNKKEGQIYGTKYSSYWRVQVKDREPRGNEYGSFGYTRLWENSLDEIAQSIPARLYFRDP